MSNVTSAPTRTTPLGALFCASTLVLPCSLARQSDADTKQFTILRAEAE
ncbi:MAG: hypothetical protein WCQ21_22700 [Verrucomicrobiota bacterium]